jgi:hypothetical protein
MINGLFGIIFVLFHKFMQTVSYMSTETTSSLGFLLDLGE